jgi:hypothetical protein
MWISNFGLNISNDNDNVKHYNKCELVGIMDDSCCQFNSNKAIITKLMIKAALILY